MILGTKLSENTGRINIFVDGEYTFSVNSRIFAEQYLRDGDEISEEQLADLREKTLHRDAFEKALHLIEYRDHSSKELYTKLCRTYEQEYVLSAIEKLSELGYIDDENYANRFAASLVRRKGFGRERIITELRIKGIDAQTARNAADALEYDEGDALSKAVEKMNIDFSDRKSVAKAYRKLYNMGFRNFSLGDYENYDSDFDEGCY